jgi:hypothetical protein
VKILIFVFMLGIPIPGLKLVIFWWTALHHNFLALTSQKAPRWANGVV